MTMGMICIHLDVMMASRKMSLTELAEKVNITQANLSVLKTDKAHATFQHLISYIQGTGLPTRDIMEYVEED